MSNELSKQEYLKRYLEKDKDSDRKRKKKLKTGKIKTNVPRLKIVDKDIDLKSINFGDKDIEEDDEEAPVVAEVIDDRPIEEKLKELYESSRWKKLDTDGTLQSHSAAISDDRISKSSYDSPNKHPNSERGGKIRHDSESDSSPSQTEKPSTKNRRHDSDSDVSLPRHITPNKSRRHDSDTDISHKHQKTGNESRRLDSDSDISPPRRGALNKSTRHNSDSDISPPRRDSIRKSKIKGKDRRYDSDSDISPPRHQAVNKSKNQKENLHKRHDSDSREIGYNKKSSLGQLKSNRKSGSYRNSDSDMSPPRSSTARDSVEGTSKKLDKTLSGLKAGLQVSKALQKEVEEMRKREKSHLSLLDDDISGRNAETIVRDRRTGLKRDFNKEQEAKAEKEEKARKYEEKYNKWGKGIEQAEDKMEKFKDEAYEMSKPLARYKDDEDLDERLKSIIHEDDPMAEYFKKKKQKNVPKFPVYSGPAPAPNRFNIPPGYRWDGVDRSNGFEKKYFEKINTTKAVQDEAYLWSVQDM